MNAKRFSVGLLLAAALAVSHAALAAQDSGMTSSAAYSPLCEEGKFCFIRVLPDGSIATTVVGSSGAGETVTQGTTPWVVNDPGLPDTLGAKTGANSTSFVPASDAGMATAALQTSGNSTLTSILSDLDSIAANAITTVTNTGTTATGIGAPADAAWSGSGSGALISIEKAIYAKVEAVRALLAGTVVVNDPGLPDTLGQKTAANSTSVVPASDANVAAETGGNLASTATNTATTNTDLGAPGATACATDTGSCSGNALWQRIAQRITSLITALGSPFQAGGSIGNTSFGATQSGTWTSRVVGNAGANVDQVVGSAVPANAVMSGFSDGTNAQFGKVNADKAVMVTPVSPASGNILDGYQSFTSTTGATTLITITAAKTWIGKIGASVDCNVGAAGTSSCQSLAVFTTAGANITPAAGTYFACKATGGANAATGTVGTQGANFCSTEFTAICASGTCTVQVTTTQSGSSTRVDAFAIGNMQ